MAGRLLTAIAQAREPMALVDLANAAELAAAQAHTYLVSLARLGLIKRTHADGRYEAGPLALRLGMLRLTQEPAYRVALPQVQRLSADAGFSAAISLPTPQGPTIVHYAHAGNPLHVNLHVGTVMALSTTATGRTYCAFEKPEVWRALWESQNPAAAPASWQPFLDELEPVRKRGMERAVDAPSPGVSSLAMPLLSPRAGLLLLVTVIGPTGSIDVGWKGPVARRLKQCIDDIATCMREIGQ